MTEEEHRHLAALSPGEREVLVLLAQGHTAKTIAGELGLSTAAVNERLRSARRKTGAGSSRELARRLTQENRDDFSEVADGVVPADPAVRTPTGRLLSWRNVMLAGASLAAVVVLAVGPQIATQQPVTADTGPDAEIIARMSAGPDLKALRNQVRTEARDEAWAAATEAGIREQYGRTAAVARSVATLSVTCAASLCEVIGRTRPGASSEDVASALGDIQSGELNAAIEQLGLKIQVSSFTTDPDNADGMAFASYLERTGS